MALQGNDKKPITDEIAVVTVRDRWSTYPSQGLTPERLARLLKEADQGDILRQMELFEEMEEKDPHLFSLLQTRKNAVLGLDWEVLPYSDAREDQEIANFVADVLYNLDGLEDAFLDLLDAIGKGFAISEILWQVKKGKAMPYDLRWRPQKKFSFLVGDEPRLLTASDPVRGVELPANKFIVHHYKARSGHPSRAGLLRVVAWMYLFKNYDLKDWVVFAEVYGMPLRLGKYDASATPEDKEVLLQAVRELGTDAAGIVPKSTDIEFVESKVGTADVYTALAEFCNKEMSKAVLGQTLTSDVSDRGSYAASKTHAAVRQDLVEADCKALAATLRRDLIRPLVQFNFGDTTRLPWIKFHAEPPEDLVQKARVYTALVRDIGLPISAEHIYETFGVPKPNEGQALVAPRNQSAALPLKAAGPPGAIPEPAPPPGSTAAQRAVDLLADRTMEEALPMLDELIRPVLRMIAEASSLEDLRARIAEVYGHMDTSRLEDLIARALYVADLLGRWSANG
ncbi:MAG: DUF935 domain-containing protein [Firmicutes bacterium]|nr:DUF935 domain-containing protein [Bacillota bacterium]